VSVSRKYRRQDKGRKGRRWKGDMIKVGREEDGRMEENKWKKIKFH
jgi:hypothetical protein